MRSYLEQKLYEELKDLFSSSENETVKEYKFRELVDVMGIQCKGYDFNFNRNRNRKPIDF